MAVSVLFPIKILKNVQKKLYVLSITNLFKIQ